MAFLVAYAFYPLLLVATLGLFVASLELHWDLARVFMVLAGVRFALLLIVEALHPARPEWKMTWPSFRRDLKYMAVNGGTAGILKLGLGWLALDLSSYNTGLLTGMPAAVEFLGVLLSFEFLQYWYHRLSHEGRGRLGAWLWRVHVPHHLPDKVYLLMHPVGHPINFVVSLAIVQLPLVLLGARQETLFLFNALMGLQGLVSHFNVDLRAGPLNYLLVGTELHRFHHTRRYRRGQELRRTDAHLGSGVRHLLVSPRAPAERVGRSPAGGLSSERGTEASAVAAVPARRRATGCVPDGEDHLVR